MSGGGGNSGEETTIYAVDRLYLPEASAATKLVKRLIMEILEPAVVAPAAATGNAVAATGNAVAKETTKDDPVT